MPEEIPSQPQPQPQADNQPWWQTAAGVLTAIAGTVTAVTGLIVALNQAGILKAPTPSSPAPQASSSPSPQASSSPLTASPNEAVATPSSSPALPSSNASATQPDSASYPVQQPIEEQPHGKQKKGKKAKD